MTNKKTMKKTKILQNINPLLLKGIAHRGLWNEQFTENGMKAFLNAKENNVAIELDVHLTKDGQLLVCHDENLLRTTGKEGIIEDLTLQEIKDNYRLHDGDPLPTLEEVFKAVDEVVPIVVELKVYRKNYKALAKRVSEELKCIKDKKNILLISFDPRALSPFKKSGFMRQLLVVHDGKHEFTYMFRNFFEGVDLDQRFLKEKKYQKYAKKHFTNVWTIENEKQLDCILPYVDTVTFQKMDLQIVRKALENK